MFMVEEEEYERLEELPEQSPYLSWIGHDFCHFWLQDEFPNSAEHEFQRCEGAIKSLYIGTAGRGRY
jgi:hypothetical protein